MIKSDNTINNSNHKLKQVRSLEPDQSLALAHIGTDIGSHSSLNHLLNPIFFYFCRIFNTYMHISSTKYRLAELTRQHVHRSAVLQGNMFHKYNKIWNTFGPSLEEVIQFMVAKTNEILDLQDSLRENGVISKDTFLNFVYLDQEDNILGAWTNFELLNYLVSESKIFLHHFNVLEGYGRRLEKTIKEEDKMGGKSIYGMFGAVDEQYMGTGISVLFSYDGFCYLKDKGFEVFYSRTSNIKSFYLMLKCGAEMTAEEKVIEEGNHHLTLSFIRLELSLIHKMRPDIEKILSKLG